MGGLIVCAVILLFPVLASSVPGKLGSMADPWRDVVFNFQTLFAGILAVGAAYLSVRQMNVTDERSEQRHKELVTLQLRPDRLRLERAVNPQLEELKDLASLLKQVDIDLTGGEAGSGDIYYRALRGFAASYLGAVVALSDVFSRGPWEEGKNLFDGRLTRKLEVLQTRLTFIREHLGRYRKMTSVEVTQLDAGIYKLTEFEGVKLKLFNDLLTLQGLVDEVISEIERTKSEYGIA